MSSLILGESLLTREDFQLLCRAMDIVHGRAKAQSRLERVVAACEDME